jgi:hypothetical protein
MGKSLQNLGLKDDVALPTAGQDLAGLPEFGTFREPPQPGAYRFALPPDLTTVYEPYDTPTKTPPQRVRVIFDRESPLTIVQSPLGRANGEPFETRLSNEERARGKDKSIMASDWDYLLRAFGVKQKPASNTAYVQALIPHAGKQFGADIRFSWKCDTKRNIRVKDAAGAIIEVQNHPGCGNAYYQEDLPNGGKLADGLVPSQIQCQCGALLRCFANLDNIRP